MTQHHLQEQRKAVELAALFTQYLASKGVRVDRVDFDTDSLACHIRIDVILRDLDRGEEITKLYQGIFKCYDSDDHFRKLYLSFGIGIFLRPKVVSYE